MKKIILKSGHSVIFDDIFFELVSSFKWYLHKTGIKKYARGYKGKRSSGLIYFHHLICPLKPGFEVDHIDGNGLNNQASNLRLVTRSKNNFNRKKVKGFYWEERTKKWRSEISMNGVTYKLGRFKTKAEARLAYLNKKQILDDNQSK